MRIKVEIAGDRLDKFLCKEYKELTRSYIGKLIEDAQILVNGKKVKTGEKLKIGDIVDVEIPPSKILDAEPEDIVLDIFYEDNDMLVVNKPQGMVVHPAAGNYSGTLVNALLKNCEGNLSGINGVIRPGIVHRIDKNTSGLLLVAKTNAAHLSLAAQIKEHSINRIYIALIYGHLKEKKGTINAPIARSTKNRKRMCVDRNGRRSVTHYEVIEEYSGVSLVRCKLETGRTHQIRVHLSSLGHPVVGDDVYGRRDEKYKSEGQFLHATCLGFIHPTTGEYMEFTAPLPEYFQNVINKLENNL